MTKHRDMDVEVFLEFCAQTFETPCVCQLILKISSFLIIHNGEYVNEENCCNAWDAIFKNIKNTT